LGLGIYAVSSGMNAFTVSPECLELGLRAGAIILRDVRIGEAGAELRAEIAREVQTWRERPDGLAELVASPGMQILYEVFRRVGAKPRRRPPSVQRLVQYARQRSDLPAINNLVDAYNLMSLRTRLSMGAHDLDRIALPVALRLFSGREQFTPLGADGAAVVTVGEFGYVDAEDRVLCRLDVLQADFSKVTTATTNVLLIIEGTAAHARGTFQEAFDGTIDLIRRHCGGTAEVAAFPV